MNTEKKHMRTVKSFVKRETRMTASREKRIDRMWPAYGLSSKEGLLDFSKMPKHDAVVFEIGFGMGGSFLEMAKAEPNNLFIGVEVHRPGVSTLLAGIEEDDVQNIRIYCEDALDVLKLSIPDESLDIVHLYFPDPWPKKKHHKRRILQDSFLALVSAKLKPKGVFHMATDWAHYAESALETLDAFDGLENESGMGQFSEKPERRPETKFERRGINLGHDVWDLIFVKV